MWSSYDNSNLSLMYNYQCGLMDFLSKSLSNIVSKLSCAKAFNNNNNKKFLFYCAQSYTKSSINSKYSTSYETLTHFLTRACVSIRFTFPNHLNPFSLILSLITVTHTLPYTSSFFVWSHIQQNIIISASDTHFLYLLMLVNAFIETKW